MGARTTSPKAAPELTTEARNTQLAALERKGRTLTIVGAVLTAVFLFTSISSASNAFYWLLHGDVIWFLEDMMNLLPIFCFLGGGAGCLLVGLRRQKKVRRFRQYLAMIGRRTSISLASLASATGASPAKIRDDLEDMLDENLFPNGYLDLGSGMLVVSGEGWMTPPRRSPSSRSSPSRRLLRTRCWRRSVPSMTPLTTPGSASRSTASASLPPKFWTISGSTRINPPQLHSFLSYYLPTTLKILRAYAQLEDQEVEGENITAAMERIEGMMDKVVEGFEKQLDQLFQGDALDITTDVEVLERMLSKDGLSSQDAFVWNCKNKKKMADIAGCQPFMLFTRNQRPPGSSRYPEWRPSKPPDSAPLRGAPPHNPGRARAPTFQRCRWWSHSGPCR